ncbi:hypothetical protein E1286_01800 [Nonomuraea terrae]|uniref:DUF8175 domain-containing protein n=1 Tax=Nonomuraea terrae TaxID=2530383 RepID=A0A4R4ZD89_9ACTN|nr:hypothetical protein [Nonomuraea terrae]TDD56393.1 hypothetical protein E1286_01800 [Nonomuraea terrae]
MTSTSRRSAESPDLSTPASPHGRGVSRGAAFWAAAVFVALLAVPTVIVLVLPDRDSTADRPLPPAPSGSTASASAAASAAAPPPMPSTSSTTGPGRCPATSGAASRTLPTQPPDDVVWTVFHGVAEPASREHGPHRKEGDVNRCHTRTPTGALIAAWQIATRFVLADDWRRVVRLQVMPGPGRDAYVAQRSRVRTDTGRTAGGYGQLAAFAIASYTPDVATVQLVSRFAATGHLQVNTVTVVWSGDDWRLRLQPDGSISPSLQAVTSLAGFVPWGGV